MNSYSQPELKSLSLDEAKALCSEIREYLTLNVTELGGHLASNLGIAEISLALLRIFNPPEDKIIYDTGHQSYVHKLLTGRLDKFPTLRSFGGLSGFTKRDESEFDPFGAGHCSTSISAALGFARADRITGNNGRRTVAVIGDGAFSGGLVYEALNNIEKDDRLIIVLNDNEMSISKNVGLMANYLNRIRTTDNYYSFKHKSEEIISAVPIFGPVAADILRTAKNDLKTLVFKNNLFEQLGVYYLGPADGNDLRQTELLLKEAKRQQRPVIVHLHTVKGKGYAPAEKDPSAYHSIGRRIRTECAGTYTANDSPSLDRAFSQVFGKALVSLAAKDGKIAAITAAMTDGVGLLKFRKRFPERFFDVGIAEEHAVTFCGGAAAGGLIPVFAVYSTFFQRAFDELFHDIALQNLHAVICLDRAGLVGEDGPTHHGLFDVSLTLPIPNVSIYSPATSDELKMSLGFACQRERRGAYIIRYPKGEEDARVARAFPKIKNISIYKGSDPETESQNCDAVIFTYGRLSSSALEARELLAKRGISAAVIKFLCIKPVDIENLLSLINSAGKTKLYFFLEEGMKSGGFFEGIVSALAEHGALKGAKVLIRAVDKFIPQGSLETLMKHCRFDAESVSDDICSALDINKSANAYI